MRENVKCQNPKFKSKPNDQNGRPEDRKTGMLEYWNNGVKNEGAK